MSDTSDEELDLEAAKAKLKRQKRESNALIADLIADQVALIADKDALIADKDALIADQGAQIADQGAQIADQGALIADKDALIVDQGAQIADKEALIADQGALIVDQGAQLDWSRWLTLDEITETMQSSADSSKYSKACKSYKTLFNSFRPRDPNSRVAGSARPAVKIGKGMLDTTFKENAHGWPHDPTCSDTWEGLVGPLLDPVPGILQEALIKMTALIDVQITPESPITDSTFWAVVSNMPSSICIKPFAS
jgi:hypothetical protein